MAVPSKPKTRFSQADLVCSALSAPLRSLSCRNSATTCLKRAPASWHKTSPVSERPQCRTARCAAHTKHTRKASKSPTGFSTKLVHIQGASLRLTGEGMCKMHLSAATPARRHTRRHAYVGVCWGKGRDQKLEYRKQGGGNALAPMFRTSASNPHWLWHARSTRRCGTPAAATFAQHAPGRGAMGAAVPSPSVGGLVVHAAGQLRRLLAAHAGQNLLCVAGGGLQRT